jgi:TonB-linked SusC/RagA family outer membrane protein
MEKCNLSYRQFLLKQIRLFVFLFCLFGIAANVSAQTLSVAGTVSDKQGEPLIGVSVTVKGTTNGTITDINGRYQMNVAGSQSILAFSYIGYATQEVTVGNRKTIDVVLEESSELLKEVVVVGYGTMKVKDLTSSITTVRSEDLVKTPSGQAMQALQGKVAGMQVVSSGNPGSSPTVRVRGIGTYPVSDGKSNNNESPLYVVDGIFYTNIDFLNPADIATVSVLKDASAAAIYGVRAANGVILIETKSGAFDKAAEITVDSYYGLQRAQNVLKMANAEQFVTMSKEEGLDSPAYQRVLNAMQRWGRSRVNPNVPDGINTDWYNEILRVAPIQNHSLDVSGGSSKASYSVGASYFKQDGILDMKNEYGRFNLRTKVDFKANNWLTVGGNILWSQFTQYDQESSAWRLAYFAVPIMPVYDPLNTKATPAGSNFASAQDIGFRNPQNPMHLLKFSNLKNEGNKLMGSFYLNVDLIPKQLSFKTSYNNAYASQQRRNVLLPYFVTDNYKRDLSNITKRLTNDSDQTWDNVLTYTGSLGNHNLTVMAGSSYRDTKQTWLEGIADDFPTVSEQTWYIAQGIKSATNYNDDGLRQYGMSYFGRVSYNYLNRYLFYGTFRADGSSKYQEKWGYFPTVGVGWVISEENFMKDINDINYLKLRASWGQLGNDRIGANIGAKDIRTQNLALNDILYMGNYVYALTSSLKWELTEETDFGISAAFLRNRLSLETDYYSRDTKNAVISVIAPGSSQAVDRNVGVFRNTGFEFALNWNDNISKDFSYQAGFNFSTLKNKVIDLYGQEYLDGGTAEFRQRSYVGEPLLSFFGYKALGVYQNEAEIAADPIAVANNLVPGDLKFEDTNGDKVLDSNDRVLLGSYFPTFSYGGNLGLNYKGIELSANFFGQTGNKILNRNRGEYLWTNDTNIDADLAQNRWHGEGTSNKYPSASGLKKPWNQVMSTYYLESGAFFRVQNVQLGYNLKNKTWFGAKMPDIKLYVTADRPLTVFKYNGFNPEVANGVDSEVYPIPAVYTVGINLRFR